MKEIKLTDYDIRSIKEAAVKKYVDNTIQNPDSYVALCYVQSTIDFISAKKYIVKDGKLYAEEKTN